MSLWQQLIDTVEAHRRHGDLQEAILQAAFLFEKANLAPQLEATVGLAHSQGWTREVVAEPVDLAACEQLAASLQQFAMERPDDPSIGSVFWALGKVSGTALVPFFQGALREHVHRNPGTVYQILIALENRGERPFPRQASMSVTNVVENVAFAEAYLARIGVDSGQ
jgi:hypothetical protein